jgi:hypothetical protein
MTFKQLWCAFKGHGSRRFSTVGEIVAAKNTNTMIFSELCVSCGRGLRIFKPKKKAGKVAS